MTNKTFVQHQTTLGLNNRQLADRLRANEGSVSRWRKDMPIPDYIAGFMEALVEIHQVNADLLLTLGEVVRASRLAHKAGLQFSEYIAGLVRKDIADEIPEAIENLGPEAVFRWRIDKLT